LFGGLRWQCLAKQVGFAGKGVDLNDLTGLLQLAANASFEIDTAVDQALDEGPPGCGVARNSLSPQFLVTLPVFPWRFLLAGATFLQTAQFQWQA
jgi:hypothetical protein